MTRSLPRGRSRALVAGVSGAAALAVALVAPLSGAATAATASSDTSESVESASTAAKAQRVDVSPNGVYIVELKDAPAVAYRGGQAGLAPTAVGPGQRIDRNAKAVQAYVKHLDKQRAKALAKVRGGKALVTYSYTSAGFAARMTHAEAVALAADPDVLAVTPDGEVHADSYQTPTFLGLTGDNGVWSDLGGTKHAGEGIIIGDLDTGLNFEHPAVAPLPASPTDRKVKQRWNGTCWAAETGPAHPCTNKVIGAKWFGPGTIELHPQETISARDLGGHGTHTATTAAGNYGVDASIEGKSFGKFSGVAPAARIAVYKVLWTKPDGGGSGNNAFIVKGIDEAVADGVDVINFSISGSQTAVMDATGRAFYHAAKAGVFVAVSAGNDGPGASTVAKNYPWVTTVANGTHDVGFNATVTVTGGGSYTGVGIGAAVPTAPIVLASQAGRDGAPADAVRLCFSSSWAGAPAGGALDPAKVAGKIVVCDRGVSDRVDKSKAVKEAGGVGLVLTNTSANSLNADVHSLPTVHIDHLKGAALKAEVTAAAAPTAAIAESVQVTTTAPKVASTSSRGPAQTAGGDLLKPDVMAPGTDVLAGVDPRMKGRQWDLMSGTSMSTPHIAGIGALLLGRHPSWSPMTVKSNIMTTASTVGNDGNPIRNDSGTLATPFDYGSGQVVPANALEQGLAYDSDSADWDAYLCGQKVALPSGAACSATLDASDLNVPSIAIGDLVGTQTVTRTIKNVTKTTWEGDVTVKAPAGVSVEVSPQHLVVAPGAEASYTVSFARTTAPFGAYAFGSLTWQGATGLALTSQVAVRPLFASVAPEHRGSGASGSLDVTVRPGFSGSMTATVAGLAASPGHTAALSGATGQTFPEAAPVASSHTAKFSVTVPAGTKYLRVQSSNSDFVAGTDSDLFLYRGTTLVGKSTSGTSAEWVNVTNPVAATYDVYLDLWAGADQTVRADSFVVGTDLGNLTVTPNPATVSVGAPTTVQAAWTSLDAAVRYLGRVSFSDGSAASATTSVFVNTPAP